MDSRESTTLRMCTQILELSMKANLREVALFLYQNGVILSDTYDAVTSVKPYRTSADKAHELFGKLSDAVKLNDNVYQVFVDYLRLNPVRYKVIVDSLDREYAKQSSSAAAVSNQKSHSSPSHQETHKKGTLK